MSWPSVDAEFLDRFPYPSNTSVELAEGYRIDLLVDDLVVVEVKACDGLNPIHQAQLLSYLRLSGRQVGLLLNFHETSLRRGLKRLVYNYSSEPKAS